jgi:PAS domain S-box-containing protein
VRFQSAGTTRLCPRNSPIEAGACAGGNVRSNRGDSSVRASLVTQPYLYFCSSTGSAGAERPANPSATNLSSNREDWTLGLALDGRIVKASDGFCHLLGYEPKDLLGKQIDTFTAKRVIDVSKHLGAIYHFGWFVGLWMRVCQDGKQALLHFVASVAPDLTIEMRFEAAGQDRENRG